MSTDLCGLICACFTYMIHISSLLTVSSIVLSPSLWPSNSVVDFLRWIYYLMFVMSLAHHFRAQFTDPGVVPPDACPLPDYFERVLLPRYGSSITAKELAEKEKGLSCRVCGRCNGNSSSSGQGGSSESPFKPPRAHHDSITGRCVVKFDHYCPWVCNAVGYRNHKFFLMFIFWTMGCGLLSGGGVIGGVVRCAGVRDSASSGEDDDDDVEYIYGMCNSFFTFRVLLLAINSLLFTMFTLCMLIDQSEAVLTNVNAIGRLKKKRAEKETKAAASTIDTTKVDSATQNSSAADVDVEVVGATVEAHKGFNEVFGGEVGQGIRPHWFLPTAVTFPEGMEDYVRGFYIEGRCVDGGWTTESVKDDGKNVEDSTNDDDDIDDDEGDVEMGLLERGGSGGVTVSKTKQVKKRTYHFVGEG